LLQATASPGGELPDSSAGAGGDSDEGYLDAEIVADELRAARRQLDNDDVLVAKLLARNALALNMLTETEVNNRRSGAIMAFLRDCSTAYRPVRRKCHRCGGSGKGFMMAQNLHGQVNRLSVPGKRCRRCGGKGTVADRETIAEKKLRLAQAAQRFRTLQQGRKRILIGQAWFPLGLEETLSIRRKIALKCAAPMPCPDCMGLMSDDCSACNGSGKAECTNRACENGQVEVEHTGLKGTSVAKRKRPCRVCGGNSIIACEKCQGAGTVLCEKCNGSGECNICTRCNGTGVAACRKCKGSRTHKGEVCVYCAGGGVSECTSCGGAGRKRR